MADRRAGIPGYRRNPPCKKHDWVETFYIKGETPMSGDRIRWKKGSKLGFGRPHCNRCGLYKPKRKR